jgi:hypothetical protein
VLGLVILRGEEVVSLVLEGPPPAEEQQPLNAKNAAGGSGLAKAVGRGMAMQGGPGGTSSGPTGTIQGVGPRRSGLGRRPPRARHDASAPAGVQRIRYTACAFVVAGTCLHTRTALRVSTSRAAGRAASCHPD